MPLLFLYLLDAVNRGLVRQTIVSMQRIAPVCHAGRPGKEKENRGIIVMGKNKDVEKKDYRVPYPEYAKLLQTTYRWNHYIFYDWHLDLRAGGPTGYLANLKYGLDRLPEEKEEPILINFAVRQKTAPVPDEKEGHLYQRMLACLCQSNAFNRLYVNNLSRSFRMRHEDTIRFLNKVASQRPNPALVKKLDLDRTRTIHVHELVEAIRVRNELLCRGRDDIKVILTCHMPESAATENYHNYLEMGYGPAKARQVMQCWAEVERRAYQAADILIYPSPEAMLPARHRVADFDALIRGKDVRFAATGVNQILLTKTRAEAKKAYGVDGKFVVAYMGRHNAIKGYDILQQAAKQLLNRYPDVVFLNGGTQGREFRPLSHPRWIECGRVQPSDLFAAADVFVLPNRETYYDLVLLEAMSAGVPVIASNTGGNISVKQTAPALFTYDNGAEGLCQALQAWFEKPQNERDRLGRELQQAYFANYTVEQFAERYRELVRRIYSDYDLL